MTLSSGQFWALVLVAWFAASAILGWALGKMFKMFNG